MEQDLLTPAGSDHSRRGFPSGLPGGGEEKEDEEEEQEEEEEEEAEEEDKPGLMVTSVPFEVSCHRRRSEMT